MYLNILDAYEQGLKVFSLTLTIVVFKFSRTIDLKIAKLSLTLTIVVFKYSIASYFFFI